MPKNHGVSPPAEHESDIKELLRRQLKGLHVICCEIFKITLDLEIGLNGVLRHGEREYRFKKSHDVLLRVYASIFQKIQICPRSLKLGMKGLEGVRNPNIVIQNPPVQN